MAAVLTKGEIKGFGENGIWRKWTFDGTTQTGDAVEAMSYADRSIQVSGSGFGGSTLTVEGSNNSTNGVDGDWVTLTDPAGAALTFTAVGLKQILQVTRYIRTKVTGGAATNIVADLVAVRKGF